MTRFDCFGKKEEIGSKAIEGTQAPSKDARGGPWEDRVVEPAKRKGHSEQYRADVERKSEEIPDFKTRVLWGFYMALFCALVFDAVDALGSWWAEGR